MMTVSRPVSRRLLLAVGAAVGAGAVVSCGSGSTTSQPASTTPAPEPSASAAPLSASPSASAEASPLSSSPAASEAPQDEQWLTGESSSAPAEGSALVVSGFRVGAHPEEGYDRVVVELTGPGAPGWDAMWVDQAHTQGKGDPIELSGSHTLVVYGTGAMMALAEDVPGALDSGDRQSVPEGTGLIEADLQLTFEDQYQLTLGTESQEYRVFTLTEPTRLVVDVRRP